MTVLRKGGSFKILALSAFILNRKNRNVLVISEVGMYFWGIITKSKGTIKKQLINKTISK